MSNLEILLANDRIAWLDREASAIQRRAQVQPVAEAQPACRPAPPAPPRLQPHSR